MIYEQAGETKVNEFCSEDGIYDLRIIYDRELTKLDLRSGQYVDCAPALFVGN